VTDRSLPRREEVILPLSGSPPERVAAPLWSHQYGTVQSVHQPSGFTSHCQATRLDYSSVRDWPGRVRVEQLRQWPTFKYVVERVTNHPAFEALFLCGSFATGRADKVSDIDFIALVADGRFEEAWEERSTVVPPDALVAWERRLIRRESLARSNSSAVTLSKSSFVPRRRLGRTCSPTRSSCSSATRRRPRGLNAEGRSRRTSLRRMRRSCGRKGRCPRLKCATAT
jgi:hypothetical protein